MSNLHPGRPPMVRVSAARPCPVCEKPDWCLVAPDGSAAICARVESGKRCGGAGWLHRMTDDAPSGSCVRARHVRLTAAGPDLGPLAQEYRSALDPGRLDQFARQLGVRAASLTALSVGWSADQGAYSFPMADADGRVVGIRLRRPDGRKFAVRGGREGLFLPAAPDPAEPVLVTEGPTDAAAALTLGWGNVVGRPSCAGGTRQLVALVRSRRPAGVVVVADGDEPGRAGAGRLADQLAKYARGVRVVAPPPGAKDLRAWVRAGATRRDLDALAASAPPRVLAVRFTLAGGRR